MTDEATAAPPDAGGPLRMVLLLQEHDLALDRLRHRRSHLPERAEVVKLDAELKRLDAAIGKSEAERSVLADRQSELEAAIDAATSRVAVIERQLYEGTGVAYRDQQAMVTEVSALKQRRRQLEDDELAVMEELEPIDAALAALREQKAVALGSRAELVAAIEEAEGVLDGEIAAVGTVRAHVMSGVLPDLASEYERLRAKLDGVGAARLVGGSCSGCHLKLPATEIDRIRHAAAGTLFHCDQCGRLLVP